MAGVAIFFYSEGLCAWPVRSLLDHMPAWLLQEIMLVDSDLKGELDEYVQNYLLGKIKVIKNTKRGRLI